MEPDIPKSCLNGDHNFGQGGRCKACGIDRADTYPTPKRSGGAGARTHPLSDEDYRRQMRKLEQRAGE